MRISDWSSAVCSSDLVRRIERHPGQGRVHRNERLTIAPDALALAQGLGHRLADHDAAVLGGVVTVDMQIALGLQRDVDQAVAGELLEHVVEEADAGRHLVGAGAVRWEERRDGKGGGSMGRYRGWRDH